MPLSILLIIGGGANAMSQAQPADPRPQKQQPVITVDGNKHVNQPQAKDPGGKSKGKSKINSKSEKKPTDIKATAVEGSDRATDGISTTPTAEKQQLLQTMVSDILAAVSNVNPVEYNILAQVEVATLLWDSDRERASSALKIACARLRELMVEGENQHDTKGLRPEKRKFRMAIMRRIARLNPELIRDLLVTKSDDDKPRLAIVPDWTDEAQAIMVTATEEIEHDPAAAARLAQESLSYGITALVDFLINLRQRDKQLAEQEAFIYLNKLRESPAPPMFLLNFRRFIFQSKEETPLELQEHFFESLAIRLRRDLKPNLGQKEYADLVTTAKAIMQTASNYPQWQNEFVQLANEYETLMARSSMPVPTPPPAQNIRINNIADSPGDTREISDAALRAEKIVDAKNRDKEYKKLATEAALKSDVQLAEKLLSGIKDEDMRRKTSVGVYSPLAKRALMGKDWSLAKNYALKITDPLGRSLAIDWVAKEMSSAKQDKQAIKEVYDAGLLQLGQEPPSLNVAKGYIALAKSFLATTPEDCFATVDLAVSVLNRSEITSPFSEGSSPSTELGQWVKRKTPLLDTEETLDLTETLGPLFSEMSKHDINRAQRSASNLTHQGLSSLAQLGVARQLLDEIKEIKRVIERSKKVVPEK